MLFCCNLLINHRAGCNYSALSGADANALRWDKLGYAHLIKLSERTDETFVSRTPSTEYWDEEPPRDKIQAMSGYVEDVRRPPAFFYSWAKIA